MVINTHRWLTDDMVTATLLSDSSSCKLVDIIPLFFILCCCCRICHPDMHPHATNIGKEVIKAAWPAEAVFWLIKVEALH